MRKKPNEDLIRHLMKAKKYRGNPKNYVVLMGCKMLDIYSDYVVSRKEDTGEEKTLLLHKRHLHRFIGEKIASNFWNKKIGVRRPRNREKETIQ